MLVRSQIEEGKIKKIIAVFFSAGSTFSFA